VVTGQGFQLKLQNIYTHAMTTGYGENIIT